MGKFIMPKISATIIVAPKADTNPQIGLQGSLCPQYEVRKSDQALPSSRSMASRATNLRFSSPLIYSANGLRFRSHKWTVRSLLSFELLALHRIKSCCGSSLILYYRIMLRLCLVQPLITFNPILLISGHGFSPSYPGAHSLDC